jgi:calcineurin-like phosphoesterase family protein
MTIFFTSDSHFFHKNILKYTHRPWVDVGSMNAALIQNWNSVVKPEDSIYHLGDFAFGSLNKTIEILSQLNGKKYLVKGNHDYHCHREDFRVRWQWIKDYYSLSVQDPEMPRGRQKIILSHYAFLVWDEGHHGAWALHAHSHNSLSHLNLGTTRMDVGVDNPLCNYSPISYEQVKLLMKDAKYQIVDHHNEETTD